MAATDINIEKKHQSEQHQNQGQTRELKLKFEKCSALASSGDPRAMYALAIMYAKGQGVTKNQEMASELLSSASATNDVNTQYLCAEIYIRGRYGIYSQLKMGVLLLSEAAKKNHPAALLLLAKLHLGRLLIDYEIDYNKKKAIDLMKKSAALGYVPALHELAQEYRGTQRAVSLFEKAANKNYLPSLVKLVTSGLYNYVGEKQTPNQLLKWCQKLAIIAPQELYNRAQEVSLISRKKDMVPKLLTLSANQGYIPAMKSLAECYEKGIGVKKNKEMAFRWFKKAAEAGDGASLHRLGIQCGVDGKFDEACCWLEKAPEYPPAIVLLATLYQNERTKLKRFRATSNKEIDQKALTLYEKAYKLGDEDAIGCLAKLYSTGSQAVEKNIETAIKYIKELTAVKDPAEQYEFGIANLKQAAKFQGSDRRDAVRIAAQWFRQALERGYEPARSHLQIVEAMLQDPNSTLNPNEAANLVQELCSIFTPNLGVMT